MGAASLPDVVADICEDAGLAHFDVSALHGVVNGLNFGSGETARERLQPLMLTHGFDAAESGGIVKFRHRQEVTSGAISADQSLLNEAGGRSLEFTRSSEGELPRALRLSYIESDGAYETGAVEAQVTGATSTRVEGASAPITLDTATARQVCDRWLSEAHISRDGASVSTGRSTLNLEAGDIVSIDDRGAFRIDRVEELGRRELTLSKVEPASHDVVHAPNPVRAPKPATPAISLAHHLMDLPIIGGGDASEAAKFAAFADPWTSAASLYLSRSGEDYELLTTAQSPAILGCLATPLAYSEPDRFSRGLECDVDIYGGGLSSASEPALLNGANRAALMTPSGEWEVLQFRTAELVGTGRYRLDGFLRGQAGTDAYVEAEVAAGAPFVVLNDAIADAPIDALAGLEMDYLVGPSHKPFTHFSYKAFAQTLRGVAYRPYRPAHLKVQSIGGDIVCNWVRRSRIGGDAWEGFEAPLGEDRELYLWQVRAADTLVREELITAPSHVYSAAEQSSDAVSGDIEIAVSQISDRYGPGPAAKVTTNV